MNFIQRQYNKKMDQAIAALEKTLKQRLGFVSPEKMEEIVQVRQLPPAMRMSDKHLEMDITATEYGMNQIPFLQYRFFAIATVFDYAITEIGEDGQTDKTRAGSDRPLLYDSDGGVLSVDRPSGRGADRDKS